MPEPIPAVDSSGLALARPWFNIDDAPDAVVNVVLGLRVRRRHRLLDLAHHRESTLDPSPAHIAVEAGPPAITAR